MKRIPKRYERLRHIIAHSLFLPLQEWWEAEAKTPDQTRIIVFRRGTPKGLMAWIPLGGQETPISGDGLSIQWK